MTDDEQRAKRQAWRLANLEREREKERIKARKARAIAAGQQPDDLYRPKAIPQTDDEKRAKRRVKSAKWRAENLERAREITRTSMKRATDAKAIAEGRIPGKIGATKRFTEEELRAKRKAKAEKHNAAHLEETRKAARERGQALRDGTFVSRALPRLTDEQRRLVNVAWAHTRREMVRANGGKFTRQDIERLLEEQAGICAICDKPFGDDGFHIDHWKPLSKGGTNDPSNLKLTHPTCNLRKGAHDPEAFLNALLPPSLVSPPGD